MGHEIEVKYRATPQQVEALRARLDGPEFTEYGPFDHVDVYYAHPGRDFGASNEALRLRCDGFRGAITYKGPRLPGPTKTREEIEVKFDLASIEDMGTVLKRLGFTEVATVRKVRHEYSLRRKGRFLGVALDDAKDLGLFVEVEALAESEEGLPAAQEAVLALAAELGLSEVEPRSYLRMTLERSGLLTPRDEANASD